MNGRFGLGNYGKGHLDAGAAPSASTTFAASSSPLYGEAAAIDVQSSFVAAGTLTGSLGGAVITGSSTAVIAGSFTTGAQAVIPAATTMVASGNIAWEGQQGTSITWTIQRQHPNG